MQTVNVATKPIIFPTPISNAIRMCIDETSRLGKVLYLYNNSRCDVEPSPAVKPMHVYWNWRRFNDAIYDNLYQLFSYNLKL